MLGNGIEGPVDMPMSIVGSVVVMFAGLWIGILVPHLLKKLQRLRPAHDRRLIMGRFTRDRQATIAPAAPSSPQPSFGHAAFDPADIDDARRGHPAVSLQAFATANGLDYRNAEIFNGFLSTLPLWPEYTFNMCRGVFPGGRLGQVGHELLEMAGERGLDQGRVRLPTYA